MPTAAELRTFLLGSADDTGDPTLEEVIRQAVVIVVQDGVSSSEDKYSELIKYKSRVIFYENGLNPKTESDKTGEEIADIKIRYGMSSVQDLQKKLDGYNNDYIRLLKSVIGMTHRVV